MNSRDLPSPTTRLQKRRRPPRGSVYVAVLGVSLILAMVALASLHLERVNLRAAAGRDAIGRAQIAATSGAEFAFARIKADPSWRTTFTHNLEVPLNSWTALGDAKFKFALIDADGSLSDDKNDAVTIRASGVAGDATCVATVQIEPGRPGLTSLDGPLHAGIDLIVENDSTLTCDQPVSSNDDITVAESGGILGGILGGLLGSSDSHLNGDAWAVDDISGDVSGTAYQNQTPPREMPDAAAVFDYYLNVGTRININSIPSRQINRVVLSAKSNPYGPVNPQGIYVIDCQGQVLRVRDARIQGTLVLLSPGVTPIVERTIHWEPAAPNYPALMVRGNLRMSWDGGLVLSETAQTANFNPAGTPYLNSEDADMLDVYPGVIKGLVYVTGNVLIDRRCDLTGNLVAAGNIDAQANVNLTYNPAARDYPPPGFGGGSNQMRIVPASWRRVTR
jgi:hypothetical protein